MSLNGQKSVLSEHMSLRTPNRFTLPYVGSNTHCSMPVCMPVMYNYVKAVMAASSTPWYAPGCDMQILVQHRAAYVVWCDACCR